ncbi:3785_t:CDS:2 [Funneliformis geosporum]|uniref:3785_t:CDS:1 n=1 Tax=Funneliformis geosporum TaxID=1117311 RepID=A0A9W4T4B8_9GLOM|nr:3785_t:CDS:2 [Funneliformis geosporum]
MVLSRIFKDTSIMILNFFTNHYQNGLLHKDELSKWCDKVVDFCQMHKLILEILAFCNYFWKRYQCLKKKKFYLRGSIAGSLEDVSIGALSERDIILIKFHGIHQDDHDERKIKVWKMLTKFLDKLKSREEFLIEALSMDEITEMGC